MKRPAIILLFLLLASALSASAQEGIRFESGSLERILKVADSLRRPVFVDVYAEWCGPCRRMEREVFTDRVVGDYFNSTFVNARFDAEKGEGAAVARRYGVRAYPTFLLLDSDGRLLGRMIGGSPARTFIRDIRELYSNSR